MRDRRRTAVTLAAMAVAALMAFAADVVARATPPATEEVALSALPHEAHDVMLRIRDGGPFRYERDGVVFGNREHQLPSKPRGYYHEYTVPTPGAKNRGARRIVCGGASTRPDACWYTGDHYGTFRRIRE